MKSDRSSLRALPSVDRLLRDPAAAQLIERYPRRLVTEAMREVLDAVRSSARSRAAAELPGPSDLIRRVSERLSAISLARLRPVVNATGVVLHTNLGRACLAPEAVAAVAAVAAQSSNLEYELGPGRRGERDVHVEEHLCAITGAEAATVVNNNAAAILLALDTLAGGREVVVSRGELIEIGGSFRIPEIIAKSGAKLHAVGTTNRTHPYDYERAIGTDTALLLKVHTSNYRVVGFTAEVELPALVELGRKHGLPVMEDLGSGALVDLTAYGLPKEPVVSDRLRMGASVVSFSGDKLLGGPQAGILVGGQGTIEAMRRNPLKRALRCDKLTLAALEATLRLYRTAPDLTAALPTLRALTRPLADIDRIARAACVSLQAILGPDYHVAIIDAETEIGSGALPTETLPSRAVAISHDHIGPHEIAARFRGSDPPIIGRVHEGKFLLDMRCIGNPGEAVPDNQRRAREAPARAVGAEQQPRPSARDPS